MKAAELIALIRDLDTGLTDPEASYPGSYLQLSRWHKGSGGTDSDATTIVRQLAREKLGSFPLEEIGAGVLTQIDAGPTPS